MYDITCGSGCGISRCGGISCGSSGCCSGIISGIDFGFLLIWYFLHFVLFLRSTWNTMYHGYFRVWGFVVR